jgi:branched-chain amino acid transport system permease protein
MMFFQSRFLIPVFFILLASIPIATEMLGDGFWVVLIARLIIYALAASALNLILGFSGLVSLGHALFIGVGMYSVAIPAFLGVTDGWIQLGICLLSCSFIGFVTGLISLRTTGIAFIMITLAFAQMGYFVIVSLKQFGGDDGLSVAMASDFHLFQLSTATSVYYCAWALLVALTIWIDRLKKAPFGMVLQAGRQNSRRVNSVGLPLKRYQLMAYIISAMICGIAGMLLVNLTAYATPSTMSWLVSGDLIVMVVLGGMGTVIGPIVGAFVFLGLEEILKAFIDSRMIFLGLFIFAIAIVGKVGIVGFLLRVKKS